MPAIQQVTSMPWVKLWTEMLDDPKLVDLTDAQKWFFVQLIMVAGECDEEGEITMSHNKVAWRLRIDMTEYCRNFTALKEVGLVDDSDGRIFIVAFAKRQDRPQKVKREQWREATRRHRDGKGEQETRESANQDEEGSVKADGEAGDSYDGNENVKYDTDMSNTSVMLLEEEEEEEEEEEQRKSRARGRAAVAGSKTKVAQQDDDPYEAVLEIVEVKTGILATPGDHETLSEWARWGPVALEEYLIAALAWRKERHLPPVKRISQLAGGVAVERAKAAQAAVKGKGSAPPDPYSEEARVIRKKYIEGPYADRINH